MTTAASRFALSCLLLFMSAGIAAGPAASDTVNPPKLSRETSPGGIAYLRIDIAGAASVAIEVAWTDGTAAHPDANQDIPTVGCRLIIAGGAEGYPAGATGEQMNDLGAYGTLTENTGEVTGWLAVPRGNLDKAVALVNAHLRAPLLGTNWFNRIRAAVAAENRETHAQPAAQVHDALRVAYFGAGPVRRAMIGEAPETTMAMTLEDVIAWHGTVFTRNPTQVVVAGGLDSAEAGKVVDGLFAGLPDRNAAPIAIPTSGSQLPRRILFHSPDAKTSRLIIAGPLPPLNAGLRPEDEIILDALANKGGVLFTAARTDLHAAYDLSWTEEFPTLDVRYFRIEAEIETAKLAAAETALRQSYAQFYAQASPLRLEEAKARFLRDLRQKESDPAGAASQAFFALTTLRQPTMLSDPDGFLADITQDSVAQRLHEDFPSPSQLTVIAISPDAHALPGACVITAPEQAVNCR